PHLLQQRYRAMAVLDVGRMNMNPEKQAISIGHNMPLAAVDALSRVIAARPASLRSWCTLAVDHGGCRSWRASQLFSCPPDKDTDDPLPPSRISPRIKIALHCRIRRELLRQRPPLAARRQNIENRLHNTTQIGPARPTAPVCSRQKALDQPPPRIGHTACITQFVPPILLPSDFSPGHRDLLRIFANPMESHLTEITHPFFSQILRKVKAGKAW